MNVRQAADRLSLHPATVYDLIAAGRLGCYRKGVHGVQTGRSDSDVARELIERYVPRYRVQTLGQASAPQSAEAEAA